METEPIFLLAGAERRSRFFKAAPAQAASFCQAEKESLVFMTKHDLRAIYNGKCDKKLALLIHFLRARNEKC